MLDLTVNYAQWLEPSGSVSVVTFDKNNNDAGSADANPLRRAITTGTNIGMLPEEPTRRGHLFFGWNTMSDGSGSSVNERTIIKSNITVYAQWESFQPGAFIITFVRNNNDIGSTDAYPQYKAIVLPSSTMDTLPISPWRPYHRFTGWNTMPDGSGTAFTEGTAVTGDITVYAQWLYVDLSMEMVFVEAGSFHMGQNGDGSSGSLTNAHEVTLTKGFWIGKYEVTQEQWETVMGTTVEEQEILAGLGSINYGRGYDYPVYCVSWYDALVFCNKLSMLEELTPAYRINGSVDPANWGSIPTGSYNAAWDAVTIDSDSNGYRLPTEAQWEYAAKGGNGTPNDYIYAGSNNPDEVAWHWDNIPSQIPGDPGFGTQPVGTKMPNGLDLYDMSGNVYEWCFDRDTSYPSAAQIDPVGSMGTRRIFRGGRENGSAAYIRCVDRDSYRPYERYGLIGFRLVRPLISPHTVTFDSNSGSGTAPPAQTVDYGSSIILSSGDGLTKTDYRFYGWLDGSGTNYSAGAPYTPTGNVTLYASWVPATTVSLPDGIYPYKVEAYGEIISEGIMIVMNGDAYFYPMKL